MRLPYPLLLLAALGCLFGCSESESSAGSKKVIGISIMTSENPFFMQLANAAKEEANKHGYQVKIVSGDKKAETQAQQVQDFIADKVSAILLTPCDAKLVGAAIKEANRAGIPVFTADTGCLDKDAKVVSHVATDNYAGGKQAGAAMIEALDGKGGKILILSFDVAQSCLARVKGFREVIAAHNEANANAKIEIVAELPGKAEREKSSRATADQLEKNGDLVGVFAINDPSALGAVAAIEAAGKAAQIKVIGFDGQMIGKQAIKDGKIYADPIQFPKRMGRMIVQQMVKYFAGEAPQAHIPIPTSLYRKADAEKDPELK
jgi:ribose transport system substrate-binding protein